MLGDADLATDQPGDFGIEMNGTGRDGWRDRDEDRECHLILVAEVHERAERQAAGRGKLYGAGGDAFGKHPGDRGRIAGVAGVDPVDVPVLVERDYEAHLHRTAGRNIRGERDHLRGEVQGFDGSGTAVAQLRQLRVRSGKERRERGKQQEDRTCDAIHVGQL